ncbi:hypothetical protein DFJ73DRAFT_779785 [Zopfochytrium polystomum]|nr:hypothetical protein DFJ73DRAFT_779785 [Zopfochytrium polystomum]
MKFTLSTAFVVLAVALPGVAAAPAAAVVPDVAAPAAAADAPAPVLAKRDPLPAPWCWFSQQTNCKQIG